MSLVVCSCFSLRASQTTPPIGCRGNQRRSVSPGSQTEKMPSIQFDFINGVAGDFVERHGILRPQPARHIKAIDSAQVANWPPGEWLCALSQLGPPIGTGMNGISDGSFNHALGLLRGHQNDHQYPPVDIQFRDDNYYVVNGRHRTLAAMSMGWTHIRVRCP
eukprot:512570-Rhodomonas_salina.1